jgi:RNA polymerase sigma-70 factor (ECF subfamily)
VEEAMQQAYFDAYRHLREFRGKSAFSTWLLRIGINEALMRLRRQGRLRLVEAAPSERALGRAIADTPSPEEGVSGHELGRLAEAAIDELPAPYKSVFILREIEGLSTEEVAAALHLTKATVKQRLHRAKRQVQRWVFTRFARQLGDVFTFPATRCDRVVTAVFGRLELAR